MKHFLVCLALCAGMASSMCHAGEPPWRVGAAVVEITPPVGWRRAGGYTEVISTGVHDPLYAKALVISEDEYQRAKAILESLDQNQADFLVVVDAWRKMFCRTFWEKYNGQLPQEVQAIRLDNDTAIVALPHEVFTELGLAIKSGSPFRTTIVLSLANDLDFYIPIRRAFEEGHYEPTTCPLVPGCGERLVEAAVELLHDLKVAGPIQHDSN